MVRFGRRGCSLDLSRVLSKKNLSHACTIEYDSIQILIYFNLMMKRGHFCMEFVIEKIIQKSKIKNKKRKEGVKA